MSATRNKPINLLVATLVTNTGMFNRLTLSFYSEKPECRQCNVGAK